MVVARARWEIEWLAALKNGEGGLSSGIPVLWFDLAVRFLTPQMHMASSKHTRTVTRRGAAAVEFATCLPLLMLLLLGSIEASRAVMVQHTLQEAAHSGARLYSVPSTTEQDVRNFVATIMQQARISDYSITLDPSNKAAIDTPLEPVTVTVTVAFNDVSWIPNGFIAGRSLSARCVMPADVDET